MSHVFVAPTSNPSDTFNSLNSLEERSIEKLLCYYLNATSQLQVVKITDIPEYYFERVVFPGQRLMFEALPTSKLEIFSGAMASALLIDKIPCQRLQVEGASAS